jgi:hypothetical protein
LAKTTTAIANQQQQQVAPSTPLLPSPTVAPVDFSTKWAMPSFQQIWNQATAANPGSSDDAGKNQIRLPASGTGGGATTTAIANQQQMWQNLSLGGGAGGESTMTRPPSSSSPTTAIQLPLPTTGATAGGDGFGSSSLLRSLFSVGGKSGNVPSQSTLPSLSAPATGAGGSTGYSGNSIRLLMGGSGGGGGRHDDAASGKGERGVTTGGGGGVGAPARSLLGGGGGVFGVGSGGGGGGVDGLSDAARELKAAATALTGAAKAPGAGVGVGGGGGSSSSGVPHMAPENPIAKMQLSPPVAGAGGAIGGAMGVNVAAGGSEGQDKCIEFARTLGVFAGSVIKAAVGS